jgi:nicotinamide-nucleotide amidase
MPASTRVQALVPEGSAVLVNAFGTAPGLVMETPPLPGTSRAGLLIMLPGPPRELRPMFLDQVVPLLQKRFPHTVPFACRTLKTTGLGESLVEERIAAPLQELTNAGLEIGYCARVGEVEVRLVAAGERASAQVARGENIVRDLLREHVYGVDDEQLEAVVVQLLTERKQTVAIAESCTGGFISHRLTNVPGASAVVLAGLVTYSNEAKQQFLGVNAETLTAHGAVSEATAMEMAEGARERTGADHAVSVTGIAGPTGGTPEKPVGTVFIGVAGGGRTVVLKQFNPFDRETFKQVTSQQALNVLRRRILDQR